MPSSCTSSQNNELFWEGSQRFKSLVICDSQFESQIAIAITSRDLEHLARLPRAVMSMSWTNCTLDRIGCGYCIINSIHCVLDFGLRSLAGVSTAYMGAFPPNLFGSDWFCPVLISQPSWLWGQHLCLSTVKRRWAIIDRPRSTTEVQFTLSTRFLSS